MKKKQPYKYNFDVAGALIVIWLLLMLLETFNGSDSKVLHAISYLSLFKDLMLILLTIGIGTLVFEILFNKEQFSIKFKKNSTFNWKVMLKIMGAFIFGFFMLTMFVFLPQVDSPDSITEKDCLLIKTYELGQDYNLFGTYKRSISLKDNPNIEFIMEGILEKDGEYVSINLANKNLDKSYLQYFDYDIMGDKNIHYGVFMFRNKNIIYLDNLKIITTTNKCNLPFEQQISK